jgi:hypothetical protein
MWDRNRASYANGVYSSPQDADLSKISSVFIHYVYVLNSVWWPLFLKRAVDICSLWLWCYMCWYRLITLMCLRFNNFVRHIALRSEIYFVHNGVFMVPVFIRIYILPLHSFMKPFKSVVLFKNIWQSNLTSQKTLCGFITKTKQLMLFIVKEFVFILRSVN